MERGGGRGYGAKGRVEGRVGCVRVCGGGVKAKGWGRRGRVSLRGLEVGWYSPRIMGWNLAVRVSGCGVRWDLGKFDGMKARAQHAQVLCLRGV